MKVLKGSLIKTYEYSFKARIWKYKGKGGWHFVTLPGSLAKRIRKEHGLNEEGWGRLKVTSQVGETKWATAIWFDSKTKSYLLPLKAEVRTKEGLEVNYSFRFMLSIQRSSSLWG